ncbi:fatty-acid--CoA ligase [Sphingobium lactosutens]|uniref:acyl-CoA synthetase n=1 Tax=Sphingobium lactosutens TaxID=522773 RepID=UPI0015BCA0EA|nr:long-chain fatty acid--CoA ligase [Sphingobium lactosutens]NWK96246.1 fatty-acid--CoA ligase [Sphingobium lactosutens]
MPDARTGAYLTQPLHRLIRELPNAIATVDRGRRRTWAQVGDRIARLAGLLIDAGLRPGDRVALLAQNSDLYLDYMLGVWWAGGVLNPVNIRWTVDEIAFSLTDCTTSILIVDDHFSPMIPALRAAAPTLRLILTTGPAAPECVDYESALAAATPVTDRVRNGEDLAAILYTGGTTGRPKGVMLTHRALTASAMSHAGSGECAPGACMMHTAPLFHVGAMAGVIAALLRRSRHVFVPAFEPEAVMGAIQHNGVTDVFLVPTMIQALLDHPRFPDHDLSSIERLIYAASPISPALLDRTVAAMPRAGFVQAYGMTETSAIVTLLGPSDHDPAAYASGRVRSVGRATMSAELRIAAPDGCDMPPGEAGEILVRGESVMTGYWNRPQETADALQAGWMHTGDLGRMDEAGYLYIMDRLKDMILTGGENVYSAEVEAALASHPSVQQCAVVARPDERWGEVVHAVLVIRPGHALDPQALTAHCRQSIAGYKCPRSFEQRTVMPLSAAGKILKATLRDDARRLESGSSSH